ncbi:hypothetical protein KGP26_29455 (plasmid) [Serratia sp. JSRIV002]|uniref:hypothetical protein n=1 Tax=Serratia sp. JSRIV002 TaxID=2831894 RepID=UPI001CC0994C|nr:hypothetical protein [Serratia sp. JSRIV002]UAN54603.1 hypothetical protein KGP26_29455 [Serratia sp. JSRIV002]
MNTCLENASMIYPVMLEPCLPDYETDAAAPVIRLDEPDNLICCELLTPLASQLWHCGITRHEAGYDCDVILLPLDPVTDLLKNQPSSSLTEQVLKACRRWSRLKVEFIRLTLPRRQENFGIEQQVWGHESAGYPPALRRQARQLTGDCCDFCHYQSKHNSLIFRDNNPENQAENNLGVACAVCACSRHLNRLGANDGVMVYLPELAPADLSHLLRAVVIARQQGDERQKQGASLVLRWLAEHRKEAESFWGTSHPGEFGQALMQAPVRLREDLQQRLRHIALIPNPDLLARHIGPAALTPDTWLSLFNQYHSLA